MVHISLLEKYDANKSVWSHRLDEESFRIVLERIERERLQAWPLRTSRSTPDLSWSQGSWRDRQQSRRDSAADRSVPPNEADMQCRYAEVSLYFPSSSPFEETPRLRRFEKKYWETSNRRLHSRRDAHQSGLSYFSSSSEDMLELDWFLAVLGNTGTRKIRSLPRPRHSSLFSASRATQLWLLDALCFFLFALVFGVGFGSCPFALYTCLMKSKGV